MDWTASLAMYMRYAVTRMRYAHVTSDLFFQLTDLNCLVILHFLDIDLQKGVSAYLRISRFEQHTVILELS